MFFSGQSFFSLQLQLFSVEGFLLVSRIFRLCFLIMVCRLSVQLYLTFMLFLLKIVLYKIQKLSADVCLNVHAVGRVEPNYVSLPVLAGFLRSVNINFLSCPPCLGALS